MNRTLLINQLINDHLRVLHNVEQVRYLEIGLQNPKNNFDHINAEFKMSVDPDPTSGARFTGTSDHFFELAGPGMEWDLIFIDGLHHADQVERDIVNASKHLSLEGIIVLHDCNPASFEAQKVPRETKVWNGDVWRAMVGFRQKYPHTVSYVMNFDHGCGVIFPQWQMFDPGFVSDISWEEFDSNRKQLLNLV